MALITSQPKNPILHSVTTVHRTIPRLQRTVSGQGFISHNARILKVGSFNPNSDKLSLKPNPFIYLPKNQNRTVSKVAVNAAFTEALEPEEGNVKKRRILLSDVEVKRERRVFFGRKWNSLDLGTAGVVLVMHVLTLFAPFQFNWRAFWVAMALYVATGLFGITLSFHRNLSHRSFKLPKWLEYLFAYCGVLALQVKFDSLKPPPPPSSPSSLKIELIFCHASPFNLFSQRLKFKKITPVLIVLTLIHCKGLNAHFKRVLMKCFAGYIMVNGVSQLTIHELC